MHVSTDADQPDVQDVSYYIKVNRKAKDFATILHRETFADRMSPP